MSELMYILPLYDYTRDCIIDLEMVVCRNEIIKLLIKSPLLRIMHQHTGTVCNKHTTFRPAIGSTFTNGQHKNLRVSKLAIVIVLNSL